MAAVGAEGESPGRFDRALVFQPMLYLKVLIACLVLAIASLYVLHLSPGVAPLDAIGTLLCTPFVAYLVHFWLVNRNQD